MIAKELKRLCDSDLSSIIDSQMNNKMGLTNSLTKRLRIDELKEELISEDCGCGHGSDCDCGPECDCGCNSVKESTDELSMQDAVNESQERLKYLISR